MAPTPPTRDEAIAAVLEACDGAEGVIDDGTGPRVIMRRVTRSMLQQQAWIDALLRQALTPTRRDEPNAPLLGYCAGSKQPPEPGSIKTRTHMDGIFKREYKTGVCVECYDDRGLQSNNFVALHGRPAPWAKALEYSNPAFAFACPTCKVAVGQRCLTIESVTDWEGKDRGRVKASTHRARKALATRAAEPK